MSVDPDQLFCTNHPQTPTNLRCNRCEKPICAKCAVQTPTGYRCKECMRGQQKVFETALWYDYVIISVVVLVLAYLGSLVVARLGFFTILLAPIYGGIVGEAARFVVRRRRARRLFQLAAAAAVVGCLPMLLMMILSQSLFAIIWLAVYTIFLTSTFYYRLSGIRIS